LRLASEATRDKGHCMTFAEEIKNAEPPEAPPPMNGRLVSVSNVEIAVDLAKQCTSPRVRAQHRASARRMHDALARELAKVRVALEALEAEAALDQPGPEPRQERQAELFPVGAK